MSVGAHSGLSAGAELLSGPRGRRLCLELATAAAPDAWHTLFHLAYAADVEAGASVTRLVFSRVGDADEMVDEVAEATIERLVAELSTAAVTLSIPAIDDAFWQSVNAARYWQAPDGVDIVAADPRVLAALIPLAEVVAAHPASLWWRRPIVDEQWAIVFEGAPAEFDPAPDAAARWSVSTRAEEERARARLSGAAGRRYSGNWWSHPWGAPHTTGERPDGIPAGLVYVEDSLGWTSAEAVAVAGAGRVVEIRGADEWAELCRRYPLDVTAARGDDWFRTTGRDVRWLLPDWGRVAEDADAVHLTAWGYLTAATRVIDVDDEYASVIGGWGPDETYWLTGRVREIGRPRVAWLSTDGPFGPSWVRN